MNEQARRWDGEGVFHKKHSRLLSAHLHQILTQNQYTSHQHQRSPTIFRPSHPKHHPKENIIDIVHNSQQKFSNKPNKIFSHILKVVKQNCHSIFKSKASQQLNETTNNFTSKQLSTHRNSQQKLQSKLSQDLKKIFVVEKLQANPSQLKIPFQNKKLLTMKKGKVMKRCQISDYNNILNEKIKMRCNTFNNLTHYDDPIGNDSFRPIGKLLSEPSEDENNDQYLRSQSRNKTDSFRKNHQVQTPKVEVPTNNSVICPTRKEFVTIFDQQPLKTQQPNQIIQPSKHSSKNSRLSLFISTKKRKQRIGGHRIDQFQHLFLGSSLTQQIESSNNLISSNKNASRIGCRKLSVNYRFERAKQTKNTFKELIGANLTMNGRKITRL